MRKGVKVLRIKLPSVKWDGRGKIDGGGCMLREMWEDIFSCGWAGVEVCQFNQEAVQSAHIRYRTDGPRGPTPVPSPFQGKGT